MFCSEQVVIYSLMPSVLMSDYSRYVSCAGSGARMHSVFEIKTVLPVAPVKNSIFHLYLAPVPFTLRR
jgi:hypothetical protein